MRVTTKMMNNSMMTHMAKNKSNLYDLEEQYDTGKKIQRPSDDPIVAVRALKLRSAVSELSQYLDKNIPDARSWMEVTESSLKNMNGVLTSIYSDMSRGANDTLTTADRATITENFKQLKQQMYQEGDANYAGRYVFTGYKTDSSLTFTENETNLNYTITQDFAGTDIEKISKVTGGYDISDYNAANPTANSFDVSPQQIDNIYRIQLGYGNLVSGGFDTSNITYTSTDTAGNETINPISSLGITVNEVSAYDNDAYNVGDDEIRYLSETGELIMGALVYDNLRLQEEGQINVVYSKNQFTDGDVKPEHYYDCTVTNQYNETTTYEKKNQDIYYEINFNQKLQVNSTIEDVLENDFGRKIDDILASVEKVGKIENEISEIDKLLENTSLTVEQSTALTQLKLQKELEYSIENDLMTDAFETGLKYISTYQSKINVAVANIGSRINRLDLVEDRLNTQKTDYTELMSENEDVDIVETYINLTAAENLYNASLSISTKIGKTSLLDYL